MFGIVAGVGQAVGTCIAKEFEAFPIGTHANSVRSPANGAFHRRRLHVIGRSASNSKVFRRNLRPNHLSVTNGMGGYADVGRILAMLCEEYLGGIVEFREGSRSRRIASFGEG